MGPDGCRIGNVQVLGFVRRGTGLLKSSSISVTPGTSIDSNDPALLVEAHWTAKPDQSLVLTYRVTVVTTGGAIGGGTLEMQFGQISGTGTGHIDAELCPVGENDCMKLQTLLGADRPHKPRDAGELRAPVRELQVNESLELSAGRNGSAQVNGFMTVFRLASKH